MIFVLKRSQSELAFIIAENPGSLPTHRRALAHPLLQYHVLPLEVMEMRGQDLGKRRHLDQPLNRQTVAICSNQK